MPFTAWGEGLCGQGLERSMASSSPEVGAEVLLEKAAKGYLGEGKGSLVGQSRCT